MEVEEEGACFLRYKWRARAVVESPPRHRFTERSIVAISLNNTLLFNPHRCGFCIVCLFRFTFYDVVQALQLRFN